MPEAPLTREDAGALPDIDGLFRQTHDEFNRSRFIMVLRNHTMMNLRFALRDEFDRNVRPRFERYHGRPPKTGREVAQAMKRNTFYRFYSALRYNVQEMFHQARLPAVERALPEMIALARKAAESRPAGGSLRLNPELEIPRYVSAVDVHLKPGGYHTEHLPDDVAQGVDATGMARTKFDPKRVDAANVNPSRNFSGVGASIGYWLTQQYPDFRPRRILDMATGTARNLVGYLSVFPQAEAYGIDVAAPGLRYGFAKASHDGIPLHLSQQNAEETDFPDGHFDLITSSFFLHEVSLTATKRILKECHRLLAPGGIMAHMELPPHKACDPVLNFQFDWDTLNNNEPYYARFRAQDPTILCARAGFSADAAFEITVPDITVPTFDMADYPRFMRGEVMARPHGRGGWFVFGARKDKA